VPDQYRHRRPARAIAETRGDFGARGLKQTPFRG
jgi:hypothetical protein